MLSILPVDSGVIRCICGFDHDDNFTIQCERCNAWQHAGCVNIANEASVPENYLCPECSENGLPISREEARERQKLILKQRAQQAQLQKALAQRSPEDHDEPRRRGRKRRSESEPADAAAAAAAEPVVVLNSHVYYVPSQGLLWSAAADAWRQANSATIKELPAAPRDARALPLQVVRKLKHAKRQNLGLDTLALVTPTSIPANRFVCDVTGEVLLRSEYVRAPHNQYARLGCPKPGIVFVPGFPLAIDSRRRGSQALFLRRAPQPNVRLVPRRTTKGELRVLLFTRTSLSAGDELQLGWHWPAAHPIRAAPDSPLLQTTFWLLGLTADECAPSAAEENDEDWEIEDARPLPSRPASHAQLLRETFLKRCSDDVDIDNNIESKAEPADAPDALATRVWMPAPQEPVVQTKKKLSLADYIKKRA